MKVYIVEYSGKIIGVWSDHQEATIFIKGCQQSGLMTTNARIKTYDLGSCFCLNTDTVGPIKPDNYITSNPIGPTKDNTQVKENKPVIDEKNPVYIEMSKQKIEIQHKINMLKLQKKKIEESKVAYANDIKLFEIFTESKQKDGNFVIPEIFIKKFELMTKLKDEDKLSWENFVKEYHHDNLYNEYFGLNSYEEGFLNSDDKSDISEELDIESDSDTEVSN